MSEPRELAALAALLGEPARARMLAELLAGRALTATELALAAQVAPSTASAHLAKLLRGGVLALERQGRHRYYRLAGAEVAALLEGLGALVPVLAGRPCGPRDPELRAARVCYDHLAGERGVWLFDRLRARELLAGRDGCQVTPAGEALFARFGLDLDALSRGRRVFARTCLDWSERRSHLGGALGAAILARLFSLGWARRDTGGRVVRFPPAGERRLRELLEGACSRPI